MRTVASTIQARTGSVLAVGLFFWLHARFFASRMLSASGAKYFSSQLKKSPAMTDVSIEYLVMFNPNG
jgi:hypothetical protein